MDDNKLIFDSDEKDEKESENELEEPFEEKLEETQEITSISDFTGEKKLFSLPEDVLESESSDELGKTRLMGTIKENPVQNVPVENVVKRRKRRKNKSNVDHTRTMGQVFLGVILAVVSLAAGVLLAVYTINGLRDFTGMSKTIREAEVTIDSSMSPDKIVDELYSNGIINMPFLMKTYIKITDSGEKPFLTGSYKLYSNMSYGSLITTLKSPKEYTEQVKVTIPEGLTAKEVGELLEKNYVCKASDFEKCYKQKLNKYDFEEGIEDNPNRLNMLEGYLFPDTYFFYVVDDLKKGLKVDTTYYAEMAADKMYDTFEQKITKSMKQRMEELGMSLDEVIRLASLICWEGTNKTNMEGASSVFHNRLNNPENFPMLQSDTTDTYIERVIKPATTSTNKEKMQAIADAYDTYKCEGLPAGAICNPGLDAIEAALYPASTSYYYFLASKDGTFYWAKTVEEHEQNIKDAALREENSGS